MDAPRGNTLPARPRHHSSMVYWNCRDATMREDVLATEEPQYTLRFNELNPI